MTRVYKRPTILVNDKLIIIIEVLNYIDATNLDSGSRASTFQIQTTMGPSSVLPERAVQRQHPAVSKLPGVGPRPAGHPDEI